MDNRLLNRFDDAENVAREYRPFWEDSEEESEDEYGAPCSEDDPFADTTKRDSE